MHTDSHPPVTTGDMAMTPPASADGEKQYPRGDSPRGSEMEVDSVDDDEIRPDHYYGGGKIPVFKPVSGEIRDHPFQNRFCSNWQFCPQSLHCLPLLSGPCMIL